MQYNLKNKKILITGAAGGIGNALCNKFLENDCVLICTSSYLDKLNKEIERKRFSERFDSYKKNAASASEIKDILKESLSLVWFS